MQTSGKWIIGSAASDLSLLALPRIPDTQRCLFSCSWLSSISSLARSLLVFLSRFLSPLISVFLSPSSHSSSPSSVFLTSFDLFLYLSVLCICLVDFFPQHKMLLTIGRRLFPSANPQQLSQVCMPLGEREANTHTHTHTHSHSHSHKHSHTQNHSHSHSHSLTLTHTNTHTLTSLCMRKMVRSSVRLASRSLGSRHTARALSITTALRISTSTTLRAPAPTRQLLPQQHRLAVLHTARRSLAYNTRDLDRLYDEAEEEPHNAEKQATFLGVC